MKGHSALFAVLTVLVAIFFIAGTAAAAESTASGKAASDKAASTKAAPEKATPAKTAEKKDAKAETAAPAETAKTPLEESLTVLQQALEDYAGTHAGKMPAKINDLTYLIKDRKDPLTNPESSKPLVMNASMASKNENAIKKPETFITFYSNEETPDKGCAAIFATREIKYLSTDDLKKAVEASKPVTLSRDEQIDLRNQREEAAVARKMGRQQAEDASRKQGK
jgi:hypothetical protein